MARLARFGDHRYIGTRDDMAFYDCDDPDEFSSLEARIDEEGLVTARLVQTFAPDEPSEARNRGFRPVRRR
ncbi:MAG TPA: hypothetical protein VLA29_04590 [Acidimicrobiia bacterium]|nr:hypothetical protein [Acidimicrobiia bacterium]